MKSKKKFSLSLKKDHKIKLVYESSFLYFGGKMNCVSYMIHLEIKDISKVKENNEIYEKDCFFPEKIKILLHVCSIKIVNLWKTVLIIPVSIPFMTKEKKFPLAKFPISPTGGNTSYPLTLFGKPRLWQHMNRISS